MDYSGPDRREFPRLKGSFIVSYKILDEINNADLSQTKNISEGGMMFTTDKAFPEGTLLTLYVRLPFVEEKIELTGRVLQSKEVVKDIIYETRICFLETPADVLNRVRDVVNRFLDQHK